MKKYLILLSIISFVLIGAGCIYKLLTMPQVNNKPIGTNTGPNVVAVASPSSALSALDLYDDAVPLLDCDSIDGWTLDTNGIGTGSVDNGTIKYVRTVYKARAYSSVLSYTFPTIMDFTEKKILKFDYKWANSSNQLSLKLVSSSGKDMGGGLIGKDVEPNVWHSAVVSLVGMEFANINKLYIGNAGDDYPGWVDGEMTTLWIDNIRYIKPGKNIFGNNIVIQFDDGYMDNYTNAFPLFQRYNKVATVGMITGLIGGQLTGKDMLTAAQLREMSADGWEIASHTVSHTSMETNNESTINNQMGDSLKALQALGLTVKHFIYPFTRYGPLSRTISSKYYESASIGQPPYQNLLGGIETAYGATDKLLLRRMPIGKTTTIKSVKSWVEDSMRYQTLLILYFHDINDLGGNNSWTPANLELLLKWLNEKGIRTMTTTQAVNHYGL